MRFAFGGSYAVTDGLHSHAYASNDSLAKTGRVQVLYRVTDCMYTRCGNRDAVAVHCVCWRGC